MRSTLLPTLSLLSLASAAALPTASDTPAPAPVRILPPNWSFEIVSLKGPGCPDSKDIGRDDIYNTRLTYGSNTVDGSEIYYWFVAYPYLRAELGVTNETWCETELQYNEFKDVQNKKKGDDYQFRLHKNGTQVIATYALDSYTKGTFSLTYGDDVVTDSYTLSGPIASGEYQKQIQMVGPIKPILYKPFGCGSGKFKIKTEVSVIAGDVGKRAVLDSEQHVDKDGKEQYYGTQFGFSYDWQKCEKDDGGY